MDVMIYLTLGETRQSFVDRLSSVLLHVSSIWTHPVAFGFGGGSARAQAQLGSHIVKHLPQVSTFLFVVSVQQTRPSFINRRTAGKKHARDTSWLSSLRSFSCSNLNDLKLAFVKFPS